VDEQVSRAAWWLSATFAYFTTRGFGADKAGTAMLIKKIGIPDAGGNGTSRREEEQSGNGNGNDTAVGVGLGAAAVNRTSDHSGQTSQLDAMRNTISGVTTLTRGTVLMDRYEIEQVRGVGGMSTVYRARDLRFANVLRYTAIKEMFDTTTDPSVGRIRLANFEREASILATLNHTSITKIYDYFSLEGKVYLVLEYIDGKDLESMLDDRAGPMPEDEVLRWSIQICDVLNYLHGHKPQPIVFRDMKPSNIMFDNSSSRIMLVDFGIAKVFQSDKKGTMIGTEGYSPPEQYRGIAEPRGDIYALGETMHHLLTNSDPRTETPFTFHERPPRRLNARISPATETLIMRALEYDATRRWANAEEMRQALLAILATHSPNEAAALNGGVAVGSSTAASQPPQSPSQSQQPTQPQETSGVSLKPGPSRMAIPGTAFMDPSNAPHLIGDSTDMLWDFASEDEIRSSPIVYKGVVYIGSYDSNLYALNAKSGEFLWKAATENGISSSPCASENMVFVGSEDHILYAFDTIRGRKVWEFRTNAPIRSSPKINNGLIYFGSDDQFIYCLDAKTGRQVWKYRCWMSVRSSASFSRGNIYIGANDNHLYALDATTGALRWKFNAGMSIISTPAITDGLAIFGAMDNNIYAVDLESSYAAWKFRTDGFIFSSPAVQAGRVYVGGVDGFLYCVDMKSGRLVWKYKTGGQVTSSPRVHDNAVYFGASDKMVYSLATRDGALRWQFPTLGPVPSSPTIEDGIVYIGSTDNKLYALAI